eukprot:3155764-Amphidinium_carterae.1
MVCRDQRHKIAAPTKGRCDFDRLGRCQARFAQEVGPQSRGRHSIFDRPWCCHRIRECIAHICTLEVSHRPGRLKLRPKVGCLAHKLATAPVPPCSAN